MPAATLCPSGPTSLRRSLPPASEPAEPSDTVRARGGRSDGSAGRWWRALGTACLALSGGAAAWTLASPRPWAPAGGATPVRPGALPGADGGNPLPIWPQRSGGRRLMSFEEIPFLPSSTEDDYSGLPESFYGSSSDTGGVWDVRDRATLFGANATPSIAHLSTPNPADSRGQAFNAMLASLVHMDAQQFIGRIRERANSPGEGQYDVALCHLGKLVRARVDSRFYRSRPDNPYLASSAPTFEGNAHSLDRGVDAFWPALVEKAFLKLYDAYPSVYTDDPEAVEQGGLKGYDLMFIGYDTGPTLSALSCDVARTLTAERFDEVEILGALSGLPGQKSAIVTLPIEFFDLPDGKNSTAGNRCGQALPEDPFFGIKCNTGGGSRYFFAAGAALSVLEVQMDSQSVVLQAPDPTPPFDESSQDPYVAATVGKAFHVPVSMLRDIGASFHTVQHTAKLTDFVLAADQTPASQTPPAQGAARRAASRCSSALWLAPLLTTTWMAQRPLARP